LGTQFRLSKQLYDSWVTLAPVADKSRAIRTQLTELHSRATADELKRQIDSLDQKLQGLVGTTTGPPNPAGPATVASVITRLRTLFNMIQGIDQAPTTQVVAAVPDVLLDAQSFVARWQEIETKDLPALNEQLRAAGLPILK